MLDRFLSAVAFIATVALAAVSARGEDAAAPLRAVYESSRQAIARQHADRLRQLDADYGSALAAAGDQLRRAGDLDGVLAVEAERKRVASAPVGDAAEAGLHPAVRKARQDRTAAIGAADQARRTQERGLTDLYLQRLDGLKKDLTRAGRIDEAVAVKQESERVAADLGAAGTPGVADATPEPGVERRPCPNCGGTGEAFDPCTACAGTGKCPRCGGAGKVASAFSRTMVMCLQCKGGGKCLACGGETRLRVAGRACHVCGGEKSIAIAAVVPPPVGPVAVAPPPPETQPKQPYVDGKTAAAQMKEYVAAVAELRELTNQNKAELVDLGTVLNDPAGYRGRLLRSMVFIHKAHARGVTVGFTPDRKTRAATLIPYSLAVGQTAEKVEKAVGKSRTVDIVYGVVNADLLMLLDIRGETL